MWIFQSDSPAMAADTLSVIPGDVLRILSHKLYNKRKKAALEIEGIVNQLATAGEHEKISAVITLLTNDFIQSPQANHRKGGLIGLAAVTVGLRSKAAQHHQKIVPPVLSSYLDQDSRVRYHTCEALYNIAKVIRRDVIIYFNEIFRALCKMSADFDDRVQSAAHLVNRLVKDIVTESDQFREEEFIQLLREYMYVLNPYERQFVLGWITVLDAVPEIDMLGYLPDFLDGLFNWLSDSSKETRQHAHAALSAFLQYIKNSPNVDYDRITEILVRRVDSTDEFTRLTSITWVSSIVSNLVGKMDSMTVSSESSQMQPIISTSVEARETGTGVAQRSHELYAPLSREDSRQLEANILERILDGTDEPRNLKLSFLELITENFSSKNKIGCGGCGEVYKGILPNGIVAVKRLFKSHTIKETMFDQEVKSMMLCKHQNIVRLLGYCSDTQGKAMPTAGDFLMAEERERLLCFEYISNGSLENYLTDELRGLDWCTRYQIIKGICEGLHHLHKEMRILHMDLKPANILIDNHMVPKITDFGLSRHDEKSQTMSSQRLVSPGYCAPEYLFQGKMSNKSDIYSLGIIITEIVTGSKENPNINKVLGRWRHRWNKSSEHSPLWYEQVTKCLELAQRCIQKRPLGRPFIWEIIRVLNEVDNWDGKIRDATESTFEELSPCLNDMLGIEPLEIHFPFELDKEMSCSIELTNDTDDYIAFMVSTTSLFPYDVQPKKEIIPPGCKCRVTITMQAQKKAPQHGHGWEEFYVQSTRVDENLTTMDVTEGMFDEETGKVVDEVNLPVIFNVPP